MHGSKRETKKKKDEDSSAYSQVHKQLQDRK